MQDGHRSFRIGCADCPVEQVTWQEVQDFLSKASRQRHKRYRLPTEAEWEYAARGGQKSKGYKYAGSDDRNDVAVWSGTDGASRVGIQAPNELGIFNMSGNVREWCNTVWTPNCKDKPDPNKQVVRGGSYIEKSKSLLLNARDGKIKNEKKPDAITGFRLVEEDR